MIRLIVADDAAFIREVLVQIVTKGGFEVVAEACDGEEVIGLAESLNPDVILMDIVMPKKSGIQAAIEILKVNPRIKIIACSTEGQESMLMKALEAGCCDFITKPFLVKNVTEAIRNSMRGLEGFDQ